MTAPHPVMFDALRLTRAGRLREATDLIQRHLAGQAPQAASPAAPLPRLSGNAEPRSREGQPSDAESPGTRRQAWSARHAFNGLPDLVDLSDLIGVPDLAGSSDLDALRARFPNGRPGPAPRIDVPAGAWYLRERYAGPAGALGYTLYVPSGYEGQPVPLLVMLHGCTQSPDDFAAGTKMNALAEAHTFLVAYPEQRAQANPLRCWNWYDGAAEGEAALLADLARHVGADYSVDTSRVYLAGLSAGGAMAAVAAAAHPEVFAAVGVHSGLAPGAASDLPSALAAMRAGPPAGDRPAGPLPPLIVFHGTADQTVATVNADALVAQWLDGHAMATVEDVEERRAGGRAFRRAVHRSMAGHVVVEAWTVEGLGHAWSGGSPAGSYADPDGPDASAQMVRFFLRGGSS